MRVYRIDSRVMRHLVPYAKRPQAKAGEVTITYLSGVTVKRYPITGKYFAYIEEGTKLPTYFTTTDPNQGHGRLQFKIKKAQEERSDECPAIPASA
ncbi:MAG: hypothetical protein LLG06_04065 [Desulfobacteraceae bacterium]|nr:hypothetical protein [Desulfobacteraceae bacterium]